MPIADIFAVTTAVLTVLALALALAQLASAKRHIDRLSDIERSLSTRFLGQFPQYLDEIANVLEEASNEIFMMYDLPAYAYYSNYPGWLAIRQAFERKVEAQLETTVIVYDSARRQEMLEEQFPSEAEWEEWRDSSNNAGRLRQFVSRKDLSVELRELERRIFLNALLDEFDQTVRMTFAQSTVYETSLALPIYIWVVDNRKAVFAVPSFSGDNTEFGFVTEDFSLISAFKEMGSRYSRRAT